MYAPKLGVCSACQLWMPMGRECQLHTSYVTNKWKLGLTTSCSQIMPNSIVFLLSTAKGTHGGPDTYADTCLLCACSQACQTALWPTLCLHVTNPMLACDQAYGLHASQSNQGMSSHHGHHTCSELPMSCSSQLHSLYCKCCLLYIVVVHAQTQRSIAAFCKVEGALCSYKRWNFSSV